MIKKLYYVLLPLIFLTACQNIPTYQEPSSVDYEIEGKYEVDQDVKDAVNVIEKNLKYAEEKDMEGYLSTIVPGARKETEQELSSFFKKYDMEHTILSVEVMEKEENVMLLRVEQQAIVLDSIPDAPNYRDHIAEANHTMIKENGEWLIEETIMTDTIYLE